MGAQQTSCHFRPISLLPGMRIVLTTFGTLGDVHPLIAIALEMRRRGHVPVLAVPEIFRPKIEPLGLEFFKVGPTLNPDDAQQVADLMDSHDQPNNAQRMRRLGVASVIRRQDYTAERAARRMRRMLKNPRFAERAAQVGERLRRENGLTRTCDALEALGRI